MFQKIKKYFIVFMLIFMAFSPMAVLNVEAKGIADAAATVKKVAGSEGMGYKTDDVKIEVIVGKAIQILLGLLGIIFLILTIYGGVKWMMAGGEGGEVTKAKSVLTNGVIGLVIILSAYAISSYVMSALLDNLNLVT
jgi:hypothetical protein